MRMQLRARSSIVIWNVEGRLDVLPLKSDIDNHPLFMRASTRACKRLRKAVVALSPVLTALLDFFCNPVKHTDLAGVSVVLLAILRCQTRHTQPSSTPVAAAFAAPGHVA